MEKKGSDTQWGRQHIKEKDGYCKEDVGYLQDLRQRQWVKECHEIRANK